MVGHLAAGHVHSVPRDHESDPCAHARPSTCSLRMTTYGPPVIILNVISTAAEEQHSSGAWAGALI